MTTVPVEALASAPGTQLLRLADSSQEWQRLELIGQQVVAFARAHKLMSVAG